ncbi:hypothetical protein NP233_g12840 [Leucocoprinus birnbaumii]|uniref:Integrase catalytic domain-containing protein n=1 Tax=Leucocoprinus birnbaumii TaxID=56174 RepID=A0AAD5VJC7_9AGAR|nr:hypothetical protein NP233_g12840 [Leucocoprinus birnbaumii]
MISHDLVDGLNIKGELSMGGLCEDCIFGKHTAHLFNDINKPETDILEKVYIDLWGPAAVQSAGGALYFMMIMDGCSSYRTVAFLSTKSSDITLKVFKAWHVEAERQTGRKLKQVRMDMGREWYNQAWEDYRQEHGLRFEFMTPYTHQQNGTAERSVQTILDGTHSIMAESGLPLKYWADTVQTVVYVWNFIPSSRRPKTVPAELWTGRRQDVSHLQPFGSTAYAHVPLDLGLSKLSPRSTRLTMIGYYGREGYKLLDRSTGAIHKSRDVIFEEGQIHIAQQPTRALFSEDDDPFPYHPPQAKTPHQGEANPIDADVDMDASKDQLGLPQHGIVPRPVKMTDLHDDSTEITRPSPVVTGDKPENEGEDANGPLAIRRSRREARPSRKMLESMEYLKRTTAHMVDVDKWIPRTYKEAMTRPDLWWEPMSREIEMLKERGVFEVWKEDGDLKDRKARTVAKGFTQVLGEDYDETYASVARLESVRLVCAITAARGLRLWQVDFVSAFLNSDNTFEVYMEQPRDFEEGGEEYIWKLLKTLYGTMQGAHDWAENLDRTFEGHGYYKSRADPQIRSRVIEDELTITSTWTDDILGASSSLDGEASAKSELAASYEIKDLGNAKLILGMRIDRDKDGNITLSQKAYCQHMLKRFRMDKCSPATTPLPPGISLTSNDCPATPQEIADMKSVPYREALGSLMWLQVATRPNLSFAVNLLARFANNPGPAHWNTLKHTLSYVRGTMDYGITYRRGESVDPYGYVDSDFAGDVESRKSTEGNVFFVAGGPVSWASKRQETVALSTVEAEYMAFTRATQQALWLKKFFDELGLGTKLPIIINADNDSSISNSKYDKNHRRTKHIDVKHHFVKEKVKLGKVTFSYIPSAENVADLFTKPLPRDAVTRFVKKLGLIPESATIQGEC